MEPAFVRGLTGTRPLSSTKEKQQQRERRRRGAAEVAGASRRSVEVAGRVAGVPRARVSVRSAARRERAGRRRRPGGRRVGRDARTRRGVRGRGLAGRRRHRAGPGGRSLAGRAGLAGAPAGRGVAVRGRAARGRIAAGRAGRAAHAVLTNAAVARRAVGSQLVDRTGPGDTCTSLRGIALGAPWAADHLRAEEVADPILARARGLAAHLTVVGVAAAAGGLAAQAVDAQPVRAVRRARARLGRCGADHREEGVRRSEPPGAPVFLSLKTNVSKITAGETVVFTAILTDPDGVADIVGGEL